MIRSRTLIVAAAVGSLVVAAGAPAAVATFPGVNGRIAFARFDPAAEKQFIYTINADGSDEEQLTTVDSELPDWSPDGSRVAFNFLASNGCTEEACEVQIGLINADGTGFQQLTSGEPFFRFAPTWSPDAARLAFVRPDGIWTLDAASGADERQVTTNPNIEDRSPTWSPDGQWIAFTRVRMAKKREQTALFLVRPGGTDVHRITAWGVNADSADWSPDGSRIAFNTKGTVAAPSRIVSIHPDGTDWMTIVAATGVMDFHEPSWSPDGSQLTFQGWLVGPTPIPPHPPRERALWVVNADGSSLHRIAGSGGGGPEIVGPDWGAGL